MNCRARKTPKAVEEAGTITAQKLPNIPIALSSLHCGTISTCTGTVMVLSTSRKIRFRPRNRILAKAYPDSRLQKTMMSTTSEVMKVEFIAQVHTGSRKTRWKLTSVGALGHHRRSGVVQVRRGREGDQDHPEQGQGHGQAGDRYRFRASNTD